MVAGCGGGFGAVAGDGETAFEVDESRDDWEMTKQRDTPQSSQRRRVEEIRIKTGAVIRIGL